MLKIFTIELKLLELVYPHDIARKIWIMSLFLRLILAVLVGLNYVTSSR